MNRIASTEIAARPRRPHRRAALPATRAFTLLEVILATVILVAALSVVTESLSMSMQGASETYRRQFARDLAADRLARACAGEIASLPSEGRQEHQGVEYRWRVESTSEPGADLRRIVCKVRWRARMQSHTTVVQRDVLARGQGDAEP